MSEKFERNKYNQCHIIAAAAVVVLLLVRYITRVAVV